MLQQPVFGGAQITSKKHLKLCKFVLCDRGEASNQGVSPPFLKEGARSRLSGKRIEEKTDRALTGPQGIKRIFSCDYDL